MPRPPTLSAATLLALLLVGPPGCGRAPTDGGPPDVLLVVLDTLRADRLGFLGNPRPTSPALDALAAESVVFEAAQSVAPWTAPSLLSLVTSLHPDAHGVRDHPVPARLPDAATTLAERLRDAGWATAAFTEGGYAGGEFGLDQGFDVFPPRPDVDGAHPSRLGANVDRTLAWIDAHRDEPWFVLFHTFEAHYPYHPPPARLAALRPGEDDAAEHAALDAAVARWNADGALTRDDALAVLRHDRHCPRTLRPAVDDWDALVTRAAALGVPFDDPPDEVLAYWTDLYDAGVAETDAGVGRLLDALRVDGRLDETVVVVVSDHGESLGEHGLVGHGENLFEPLLRAVLLVRPPGGAAPPRRVADVVSTVDVMPTLLELAGLPAEAEAGTPLQGCSLVPLLRGGSDERVAFGQAPSTDDGDARRRAVRTRRWRLVTGPDGDRLSDLRDDPGETGDHAPAHPEVVRSLRARLDARRAEDARARRALGRGTDDRGAPPADVPAERLEELRALGYLGDG